jgi:hypothetical protein
MSMRCDVNDPGDMMGRRIERKSPLPGEPGGPVVVLPTDVPKDDSELDALIGSTQNESIAPATRALEDSFVQTKSALAPLPNSDFEGEGPAQGSSKPFKMPRCPSCQQFMLIPERGEPYCPACNPPAVSNRIPMMNGHAPIRVPVDAPKVEAPKVPARLGPFETLKGCDMFLPVKTVRGTYAIKMRQIRAFDSWHLSTNVVRDQQCIVRTGLAFNEEFQKNAYIVQGLTTVDLDGQPAIISTKGALRFNSNVIDLGGELALEFWICASELKMTQGSFVAELVPIKDYTTALDSLFNIIKNINNEVVELRSILSNKDSKAPEQEKEVKKEKHDAPKKTAKVKAPEIKTAPKQKLKLKLKVK